MNCPEKYQISFKMFKSTKAFPYIFICLCICCMRCACLLLNFKMKQLVSQSEIKEHISVTMAGFLSTHKAFRNHSKGKSQGFLIYYISVSIRLYTTVSDSTLYTPTTPTNDRGNVFWLVVSKSSYWYSQVNDHHRTSTRLGITCPKISQLFSSF